MTAAATPRCSDAARDRGDPMAGTAAPAERWLLIEHPGPWAVDALAGSGIAPRVIDHLRHAADEAGARILLIRRPGRRAVVPQRLWAVVSHREGLTTATGAWQQDAELLAAARALELGTEAGPDAAPAPSAPSAPAADPGAWLLVCTHGRHDTCCAVRGRPVAAALAARWPDRTWECSHVGGDRFAANLVVLPDGTYYGGLDADSAVSVADGHLRGIVDPAYLRGTSALPPVAQAVAVAAHERFGPAGPRAFTAAGVTRLAPGRWQVRLAGQPGAGVPAHLVAQVSRVIGDAAQLTCRAGAASAIASYRVEALTERGPGATPGR